MIPIAAVAHKTADRIRFRMESRRGDGGFFNLLAEKISAAFPAWDVKANASTGSLLITGESLDVDQIDRFARDNKLFAANMVSRPHPMTLSITAPLHSADRKMKLITGNRMDLPGAVFVALLIFGVIELIRGNWKTPPWYTAFWYAFGLYSKSLIDRSANS